MRRISAIPLAGMLVAGLAAGPVSSSPTLDTALPRAIVLFDELPADAMHRFAALGISHAAVFPQARAAVVVGPPHAYRAIAGWADVASVYPDRELSYQNFQATQNTHVDRVRAGSEPLARPYTGKGVTVAIIDSGIDTTHPDLEGRVAVNASFDLTRILQPVGQKPSGPIITPVGVDANGHGTNLAGVAAGAGRAALNADMRGVAPEATLVNLHVGDAVALESNVLAAYAWLLDHRNDPMFPGGIRVTVNGWGDDAERPAIRVVLQEAIAEGIIVVFPAGNSGKGDGDTILYPARYPEIIAVGAACKDQDDWSKELLNTSDLSIGKPLCEASRVVKYSSRGPALDLVAPGHDIWTPRSAIAPVPFPGIVPRPFPPPPPGQGDPVAEAVNGIVYAWEDSSSMATAHVAGIVALMLEADPTLTQAQVAGILGSTARDLGVEGFDIDTGYGMADALAAVAVVEAAAAEAEVTEVGSSPLRQVTGLEPDSRAGHVIWSFRRIYSAYLRCSEACFE